MMDQSKIALEIEDPLVVGHGHPSEVDPSHVAQCHKDMFTLGISQVRLYYCAFLNDLNNKRKGVFKTSRRKCQKC